MGVFIMKKGEKQGFFLMDLFFIVIILCLISMTPLEVRSQTAYGDFNGDGVSDLVIGVPYKDIDSISNAGAVYVIYASRDGIGLTVEGNQFWHQNKAGMSEEDRANAFDQFG